MENPEYWVIDDTEYGLDESDIPEFSDEEERERKEALAKMMKLLGID